MLSVLCFQLYSEASLTTGWINFKVEEEQRGGVGAVCSLRRWYWPGFWFSSDFGQVTVPRWVSISSLLKWKPPCSNTLPFQNTESGHFSLQVASFSFHGKEGEFYFFSLDPGVKRRRPMSRLQLPGLRLYLWSTEGIGMAALPWVSTVISLCNLDFRVSLPLRSAQPVSPWHGQRSLCGEVSMGSGWGPEQVPQHRHVWGHTAVYTGWAWDPLPGDGCQSPQRSWWSPGDSSQSRHPCGASHDVLLSASKFAD